ncbi:hypothetical protein MP638_002148 [Amoeboaphelidium occidentale]|nr:hypothetical protein MP638_002148 [Amoeboaphelidium occidentale]
MWCSWRKSWIFWAFCFLNFCVLVSLALFRGSNGDFGVNYGISLFSSWFERPNAEYNKRVPSFIINAWPERFRKCYLRADNDEDFVDRKATKPKVAIVQSIDKDRVNDEFINATAMMKCYCKKHGCVAVKNIMEKDPASSMHFYSRRWGSILRDYFHTAEYVFGADTDLVPVDFKRDVADFVNAIEKEDSTNSVFIHVRRNYEITASFLGFKTQDKFAKCFVEELHLMGTTYHANYDNGDLLELVLSLVAPDLHKECTTNDLRNANYAWEANSFVDCFTKVYDRFLHSHQQPLHQQTRDVSFGAASPWNIPIRLFFPMEGIWRSYEGPGVPKDSGYGMIFDSDLFVHGFKQIGSFFINENITTCDSERMDNIDISHTEIRKNHTESLQFASDCCYWRYAGCTDPQNGINTCQRQIHCLRDYAGKTAVGIKECL